MRPDLGDGSLVLETIKCVFVGRVPNTPTSKGKAIIRTKVL